MTWTRLDDVWGDDAVWDEISYPARWHYLMMIQVCSRGERYDGVMPLARAENCSDLARDEVPRCLNELMDADLLEVSSDGRSIKVVRIEDHLPPAYLRDPERKAKQRERKAASRARKPKPSSPPPEPVTGDVTRDQSRDTRTGQDGPGQEVPPTSVNEDDEPPWRDDDPDYTQRGSAA